MVLSVDEAQHGIYLRTFFRTSHMSRSKLKGARILRVISTHGYFKDVEGDLQAPLSIQPPWGE